MEALGGRLGCGFLLRAVRVRRSGRVPDHRMPAVLWLRFVSLAVASLFLRALKRPQKQRRQAGILLQGARHPVPGGSLRRAEHLLERRTAHDLPDFFQILRQSDLLPLCRLHSPVAAEDFERGADAGEHQIGTAHTFLLQVLHPVGDAQGQFPQHIGPLADRSILWTRSADQVNAGRQGSRVASSKTRISFGCDGPRGSNRPATSDHTCE